MIWGGMGYAVHYFCLMMKLLVGLRKIAGDFHGVSLWGQDHHEFQHSLKIVVTERVVPVMMVQGEYFEEILVFGGNALSHRMQNEISLMTMHARRC